MAFAAANAEISAALSYDSENQTLNIRLSGLCENRAYSLIVLKDGTDFVEDNVQLIDLVDSNGSGVINAAFISTGAFGCTVLVGGVFEEETSPYHAGTVEEGEMDVMNTPSALTVICEEAFMGSAFQYVYIGENVVSIEDRAFQNCTELVKVYIPDSVETFGADVFSGSENVTIVCSEGSSAMQYAIDNHIAYVTK